MYANEKPALPVDIAARFIAEIFLGKIRLGRMSEPSYLMSAREYLLQLKKSVGDKEFDEFIAAGRPAAHALVAAWFDAVTDCTHPKTVENIKGLHTVHRMSVEHILARTTGKGEREGHWAGALWRVRKQLKSVCDLSISGLTLEEIREGYDELVHATVDHLYDCIDTLVK